MHARARVARVCARARTHTHTHPHTHSEDEVLNRYTSLSLSVFLGLKHLHAHIRMHTYIHTHTSSDSGGEGVLMHPINEDTALVLANKFKDVTPIVQRLPDSGKEGGEPKLVTVMIAVKDNFVEVNLNSWLQSTNFPAAAEYPVSMAPGTIATLGKRAAERKDMTCGMMRTWLTSLNSKKYPSKQVKKINKPNLKKAVDEETRYGTRVRATHAHREKERPRE